jgi:alpha-L-fucosidase
VHILKQPSSPFILLPGITQKISSVHQFSGKQALTWKQVPEGLFIYTSGLDFDDIDEILEVTEK